MAEAAKAIAILGFGAGGRYLAGALQRRNDLRLLAFDPMAGDPTVAPVLEAAAQDLGVTLHGRLGGWLAEADLVFSLVPGTVAIEAARNAADYLRAGTTYVDFNSITGDMMVEVAGVLSAAGIQVVDGGVLGNFEGGNAVPVLLVGEGAERVTGLLPASHFLCQVAPGKPGDASAIKMLRSVLMKGLETLCVECLLASESQGLTPLLLKAFDDLDSRPFVKTMEVLTKTHIVHAGRRMKEVERVAQVLEKEGIDDVMTQATLSLFRKTLAGAIPPDPSRDLAASLAALAPHHRRNSDDHS